MEEDDYFIEEERRSRGMWRRGVIPVFVWIALAIITLIASSAHFITKVEDSNGFYVVASLVALVVVYLTIKELKR